MFFRASKAQNAARKQKVFGIGLSRTGTTSLTHALTVLGYRTIHFPIDDDSRREISDYLVRDADCITLTALHDHDALTDMPVCCIYKGLERAYPDSRFILTTREKEAWLESCERLWQQFIVPLTSGNPQSVEEEYAKFLERKLGERTIGRSFALEPERDKDATAYYDRKLFAEFYDAYHHDVREFFKDKPGKLLELKIVGGEGWEKLAPFLGEPIPHEPFPFEMRLKQRVNADGEASEGNTSKTASDSDVAVVQAYLDAFRKKDLADCERFFADDALVKMMEKRFQGRRAISEWHMERFKNDASVLDVGAIKAVDDAVMVELVVTSKLLKRWRVKFGGQAVLRLTDTKIQEMGFEGVHLVR